jgi:DNA-binding GntR family transcriptional regulator
MHYSSSTPVIWPNARAASPMIEMDSESKYTTKKDWATAVLRKAIAAGEYQPGQRLRQDEVAETLDISLTPVREAFSQLAAEGVLRHVPHKGVTVAEAKTSPESIREVYRIRSALEALAVELATLNLREDDLASLESLHRQMDNLVKGQSTEGLQELNYQFHMILYRASESPQLGGMIDKLWVRIPWSELLQIPGLAQESVRDHANLINAMKNGDAKLGAQLMREHIEKAGEVLIGYIEQTNTGKSRKTGQAESIHAHKE